jgi:hypothetical protein
MGYQLICNPVMCEMTSVGGGRRVKQAEVLRAVDTNSVGIQHL